MSAALLDAGLIGLGLLACLGALVMLEAFARVTDHVIREGFGWQWVTGWLALVLLLVVAPILNAFGL